MASPTAEDDERYDKYLEWRKKAVALTRGLPDPSGESVNYRVQYAMLTAQVAIAFGLDVVDDSMETVHRELKEITSTLEEVKDMVQAIVWRG